MWNDEEPPPYAPVHQHGLLPELLARGGCLGAFAISDAVKTNLVLQAAPQNPATIPTQG